MLQLRSVLSIPFMYDLFGWLIGGNSSRATFVKQYVHPNKGDRVLDIGCGPGSIIPFLPIGTEYVGFDASQKYIDFAKKHFDGKGTFICEQVSCASITQQSFDIVLAMGILHHLDDVEALSLFKLAKSALKSNGKLVTIDPVYTDNQPKLAKWIISKDRGDYVRNERDYSLLANQVFLDNHIEIRHDLLRIPYSHIIIVSHV